MKAKLRQFLSEYCQAMLVKGLHPKIPLICPKWFTGWEAEYGLSTKQQTRKYKVPFHILEERCEIGWLNTYRVRAACLALNGYDPETENFDQSPYYANQSGSKNIGTLAVAGLAVPLCRRSLRHARALDGMLHNLFGQGAYPGWGYFVCRGHVQIGRRFDDWWSGDTRASCSGTHPQARVWSMDHGRNFAEGILPRGRCLEFPRTAPP